MDAFASLFCQVLSCTKDVSCEIGIGNDIQPNADGETRVEFS